MTFVIIAQTIARHDAIGNDIRKMHELLSQRGDCLVYGEHIHQDNLNEIDRQTLGGYLSQPSTVLIYHHSIYWEDGEAILDSCSCVRVIRYHNITPPEFYAAYSPDYEHSCGQGRRQTDRFQQKYPDAIWLSDSRYNDNEVRGARRENRYILAPFNNLAAWNGIMPDEALMNNLVDSRDINLLFVGRIVPNKGYVMLLDILETYIQNYDGNIKLNLIGKKDGALHAYSQLLEDRITACGMGDNVRFIGEITDQVLISYYLGCDFFVCTSDHEGFGVPLLEAQYLHLPVIAKDTSAVGETVGGNQVLLGSDARAYAAAIKTLYEDTGKMEFLRHEGWRNYKSRFFNGVMVEQFNSIMDKVCERI